jgi:hypothetical protein
MRATCTIPGETAQVPMGIGLATVTSRPLSYSTRKNEFIIAELLAMERLLRISDPAKRR